MNPDSGESWRDSEETYKAFGDSELEGLANKSFVTPADTEMKTVTPVSSGLKGFSSGSSSSFRSSFDDEDTMPVDAEGNLFGKYRVLNKLGGGGMGFVWLVEHVRLKQQRALKVIKSEVADNPSNLLRFRREAEIQAKLSQHPNAVLVYDTDLVGKFAYIEMHRLEGQTLKKRLEAMGPMPPSTVLWILGELCAVLGEAHRLGIVHRDIKPQNIMVVPDSSTGRGERVKVLDFGIAKIIKDAASDTASMSLHTEAYLGTYPYSSPEQLGHTLPGQTEAVIDHRSDIYSLGVLLYEMLAGARPFSGNATKILYDHAHTPPPPFARSAPEINVPPDVEAVVLRCLEKDPANRPQSADELFRLFKEAVKRAKAANTVVVAGGVDVIEEEDSVDSIEKADFPFDDGEVSDSVEVAPFSGTVVAPPKPVPLREETRPADRWRIRRRTVAGAIAASVLGVAMGLVLWQRHEPTIPPSVLAWLEDHNLERAGKALTRGWPVRVKRKDRPLQYLVLNGSFYLPEGYEPDTSSGTGEWGLPKILTSNKTGSRFILIEGGEFRMGAFDDQYPFDDAEKPGHQVTLSSYYMQEYEVTIDEFSRFCQDTHLGDSLGQAKSFYRELNKLKDDREVPKSLISEYPATGVTHRLAEQYAQQVGGELPSEAQWEFAARSRGEPQLYVWGNDRKGAVEGPDQKANVNNANGQLAAVRSTWSTDRTNQGIYGMTGNAREWCRDDWQSYPHSVPERDPVQKPKEGKDPQYVIRGGSFMTPTETARVTWRGDCAQCAYKAKADDDFEDVGFRVVLEVLACPAPPSSGGKVAASPVQGVRR
jgi:eukaryotic-like serine/threonine-protein kinase